MNVNGSSPVFPAGLWLTAASMLVFVTRYASALGLVSRGTTFILIKWIGRLYRIGFRAWRRNGGKWRWAASSRSTATR